MTSIKLKECINRLMKADIKSRVDVTTAKSKLSDFQIHVKNKIELDNCLVKYKATCLLKKNSIHMVQVINEEWEIDIEEFSRINKTELLEWLKNYNKLKSFNLRVMDLINCK